MNKIRLLKLVDGILGRSLLLIIPSCKTALKQPDHIRKILVIRPGGIGDFVLLLPSIKILKTCFPESKIDVLCEKRNAGIADLTDTINRTYLYDKHFDLLRCVGNGYDVVIDSEQWHRLSAVIAYLTGAPMRIGFDTNERNKIFTHRIPYSHDDYEACSFLNLLKPLINESFTFNENVPFAKPSSDFPANLLTATGKERDKIISIFPGASVPERRLETGKFVKVAHVFSERGYSIVLLGSANEKRISAKIKEAIADCVDLTDKISLGQTAAVLKASGLLLTADSGLMHLAYAIGTPTVSIFGSGIEKKWAPRGDMHITINKRLSCSPCTRFGHTPRCALGIKCISLIEADEIVCAMERILNQNPR